MNAIPILLRVAEDIEQLALANPDRYGDFKPIATSIREAIRYELEDDE